ncbi:chemotaxis protein CheB [Thiospirillum jenense]|uniref:protein-glutamate O-methyltransferase n=1 Tax=Thiospirillum jenense TaxID=1653858 RepID=A0A839HKH9_9GAMM|nr:chemotaxis protein CheB [Thiospirillum jenense]MBB1126979.1 PAS domain-containing protein [Thiospirillum jenense]
MASTIDTSDVPPTSLDRYVVAVGASAGGLDALERFFHSLPEHSGAAYVVIQHLSPDHKSMMANLLARHTRMPVVTVEDGMTLEPDRVHLIPPASMMSVSGNDLRLSPKNPRGLTLPIDLFFTALAREFGKYAIGVVLSGTGSDGTRGAVAINDAGGFLLAQEPESAKFDGMPRSVIATGLVDAILPPEELGPRILDHISQVARIQIRGSRTAVMDKDGALEETMHLLHHQGGINFRDYKPATVMRRIERRMQVRHVPDLENYVRLLDGDRTELNALRRELLIPVTNFFRDTESFETLAQTAIQTIVQERGEGQPIRVWVPGTSTGEEAYSLTILFAEAFERAKRWPNFKLFATDVEQHNVDVGSAGVFSEAITAEVSPERLEHWFYKRGNHFVVKNEIRQSIVFARHNLLEDPPFTRMDLVSCRNLLIYFRSDAQERALRRLQYALGPGGFMFLGSSETLASLQSDFTAVSSKHKIYRILRHVSLPLDSGAASLTRFTGLAARTRAAGKPGRGMTDAAAIDAGQALLLRSYAPTSLLLNGNQELLHVFGDVGHYLRIGEGTVTLDLPKLLPSPLAPVAQALLHKALRGQEPLRSDVLSLHLPSGQLERLRLVVRQVELDQREPHLLLSFEPETSLLEGLGTSSTALGMETMDLDRETAERVQTLERELAATRESLQATIEELETANEELQATNEELMASNEELQSSNEELQSVNEELYTVNAENQEKIEILNRLNADLDSMAKAAAIATVFVDSDLRLTRFTPEATSLFKVREGDLGRHIDDFSNLLDYPTFIDELRRTIASGEMLQREITAGNGRIYLVRVLPYAVRAGDPRGAVATFIDITTLHDIKRLQAVLDSLPEHVAVLDTDGKILMVNEAWRNFAINNNDINITIGGPGSDYLSSSILGTGMKTGNYAQEARTGIEAVLSGRERAFSMEYPCHSADRQRWFVMHASPIHHAAGGVIVSHIDISQWTADGHNAARDCDSTSDVNDTENE